MPTPDSIYGALVPDIGAGAGALPSDALLSAMERLAAGRRGQLSFPPSALDPNSVVRPGEVAPGPVGPGPVMTGALGPQTSLGQRYQNYPAATFDQRFGPYNTGPINDQDLLRQMLQPAPVIPGAKVRV